MVGRLVYALAGMESALLRNARKPIQQNVGERVTLLIADTWREVGRGPSPGTFMPCARGSFATAA
ncbi:MAG: hypothetical protein CYG60_17170 [Actinobacteria bacterium]|nr:MAG: hypothetical protein CYG60_17170 [Actinomycetota bacterium]